MKKILFLAISFLTVVTLGAQNTDGGATELLNKVSKKYQEYTSMQFHYTLVTSKDSKTLGTTQGNFYLKGNKYQTSYDGQTFFCDGVSLWNYQKATNEVSIYEYDPEDDDNMMNPRLLLKNWEKHFRAKFIRDEFSNGQAISLVDLTPKYSQSYYRIRLFINKNALTINKIAIYEKDNTIYTYHIEQFKSNVTLSDETFTFNKSKYPGVEVNDMR
ncbi:MAG: outer membrane lipoprotein carrier protein LolA [Bacteroidales bacterium]|nr:outer membrane lipoprotein carrier protein LolA [Bacteroidales bacterium]